MTYDELIIQSTPIPKEQQSLLNIRHDSKNGWYRIWGKWNGEQINIAAPSYPVLQRVLRDKHRLCIPARKDLIFCHTWKGFRHALLQGFLPGSAVVDVSGMYVKA